MLKSVAMVTSSPRITAPLCLATEREKARQRSGETVDVGRRGRLVSGGAIGQQRCSLKITGTTESSAEVFGSVNMREMSHFYLYCQSMLFTSQTRSGKEFERDSRQSAPKVDMQFR